MAKSKNSSRKGLPVLIRAADDRDSSFIYSTWLKSYSGQNKGTPKRVTHEFEERKILGLLAKSITLVAVGDSQSSSGDIYGFICGKRLPDGQLLIHYSYTKAPFRRFGIARGLLDAFDYNPGELITHSYKGYIMKDLRRSGFSLLYVPYLRDPGVEEEWSEFYGSNKHCF